MKDLFIVAKFTIKDMVKRKSFIVSNIIIFLFIIVGFNVPNIMDAINGDENSSSKFYIVDNNNIYEGTLSNLNDMDLGYEFIIEDKQIKLDEIKEKVNNGEVDEAIVINEFNGQITIDYIVENSTMVGVVPESLMSVFNNLYFELQLSKLNISESDYQKLHPNIIYNLVQSSDEEVKGNPFVIMLISIVLFFAIYFYAFQVSSSITTEKTSKIIETLVTSTTPKTIVLGKTIGIGLIGLLQLAAIIIVALLSNYLFMDKSILEGVIDLSTITPFLGIITVVYFILGFAVYALLYALTGSTVSKPEDVQSANGPVSMIAVIGFYLSYFTMMNPTSSLNTLASQLPISSPFSMPFRVMMDIATPMEIILSIVILILTIIIVAFISIKIYSQAILNYGNKIGFKDAIKLFRNKNI